MTLLSNKYNICVSIKDFRRVAFDPKTNILGNERNSLEDYIIFDVGKKSYLEDITSDKKTFRVTCYDPDRLAESHNFGTHKYCIRKDVFECDTDPILVEFNISGFSYWYFQLAMGPAFGKFTDEIIDYCRNNLDKIKYQLAF